MNCSQNDKLKLAQMYDGIAEIYEERTTPLTHFQASVRTFLAKNVHAGQRVLDLGCGPGHLTNELPLDVEVVGLDISTAMVDAARLKRPSGTYLVHDFHQSLPAELGKFDAIVANGCFDFCEDLVQVIGNVASALACGGRFYFTINERRADLPFHDARWIDAGGGRADIRMFSGHLLKRLPRSRHLSSTSDVPARAGLGKPSSTDNDLLRLLGSGTSRIKDQAAQDPLA